MKNIVLIFFTLISFHSGAYLAKINTINKSSFFLSNNINSTIRCKLRAGFDYVYVDIQPNGSSNPLKVMNYKISDISLFCKEIDFRKYRVQTKRYKTKNNYEINFM